MFCIQVIKPSLFCKLAPNDVVLFLKCQKIPSLLLPYFSLFFKCKIAAGRPPLQHNKNGGDERNKKENEKEKKKKKREKEKKEKEKGSIFVQQKLILVKLTVKDVNRRQWLI